MHTNIIANGIRTQRIGERKFHYNIEKKNKARIIFKIFFKKMIEKSRMSKNKSSIYYNIVHLHPLSEGCEEFKSCSEELGSFFDRFKYKSNADSNIHSKD